MRNSLGISEKECIIGARPEGMSMDEYRRRRKNQKLMERHRLVPIRYPQKKQ